MDAMLAVLQDLYHFAVAERFGLRALRAVPDRPLLLATPSPVPPARADDSTASLPASAAGTIGVEVYVAVPDLPLHSFPTETFDGVVARLPYGASVLQKSIQGRFAAVQVDGLTGWVWREALAESLPAIWPNLRAEVAYLADHAETIKLRAIIADEFYAAPLQLPLQSVEYAYFKLREQKRLPSWGATRPRIAGSWQQHLRGLPGVYIGVHPKTGAVLERVFDDGTGHVAYVEAVFPDQSIRLSQVGVSQEGFYTEETVAALVWREWRPVFIEIY